MKNMKRIIGAWVVCAVLVVTSGVFAQDWPQWMGANRDAKVTGFTAPATWPQALASKWNVKVGVGDGSPALVAGKLYVFTRVGDDEVTQCLDAATGGVLWTDKNPTAAVPNPSGAQHGGPRSTPAVAGGKVVTLGVNGIVTCLNAADGKVVWRKDDIKGVPRFFTSMSPIVVNGMAIVQLGGQDASGVIVAYDLEKGDVKWKLEGQGAAYSSPNLLTVGDSKQLVAMTAASVVGVGLADGKLLWTAPFATSGMAYNAATPVVNGDTVIFSGQGRGTKAVKIAKEGEVFKASDLWTNADLGVQFNTPILKDGFLYGESDKGFFFCLDAKTGQTAWTDSVARGQGRNAGYAAMVDAASVILALPSTSELIAFKPDPKAYVEVAKIKVAETPTYAPPVIAGKNVYVKDADGLTMWAFE
jgi:outer membrane protein assembly factor BamB